MTLVPIGEFARLTHVNVKRLRHYHDTGVLPAAHVDATTGFRYYDVAQADDARLVARLRTLDMPLAQIGELVAADPRARTVILTDHLDALKDRLTATGEAVAEVRAMLEPAGAVAVEYRALPPLTVLATTERVARDDITAWCGEHFGRLYGRLGSRLPAGPGGALYGEEFFTDDLGEVTAYVPVLDGDDTTELPGGLFAVAVHEGAFSGMDRTYARLGRHVAEAGIGAAGPIRESYVVGPPKVTDAPRFRTEIAWPISHPVPNNQEES